MNLEILMATMFKTSIDDIDLNARNITSNILIINQTDFIDDVQGGGVRMISTMDRGSSVSRNLAFEKATGTICLIADDDVIYKQGYEETILQAFRAQPEADIITFQIETPEGEKFNAGYPERPQTHNRRSVLKCASIEIAFRRERILKSRLKLNEEFGLGSRYKIHDEVIFLTDALKAGLKVFYVPIPIVIHPAESSGTEFDDYLAISKGAAFANLFGKLSYIMNSIFIIKKHKTINKQISVFRFFNLMNSGAKQYLKNRIPPK